jgi:hypothetical protein
MGEHSLAMPLPPTAYIPTSKTGPYYAPVTIETASRSTLRFAELELDWDTYQLGGVSKCPNREIRLLHLGQVFS